MIERDWTATTLVELGTWVQVKDGNIRFAELYRRHYSCYRYADNRRGQYGYRNRNLVLGPGEKMALLTPDGRAAFGWRKFIDASGQKGVNCAFFRNESNKLSSDLILEAEKLAWLRWTGERLYTYVNADKIKSTNPGYCFLMAGWNRCGTTKINNLLIFEKYPEKIAMTEQLQPATEITVASCFIKPGDPLSGWGVSFGDWTQDGPTLSGFASSFDAWAFTFATTGIDPHARLPSSVRKSESQPQPDLLDFEPEPVQAKLF